MIRRNLDEQYSPLYFLAALGAGGISVSFFLYLMFMVDHPDTPLVTFDHLQPLLGSDRPLVAGLVLLAMMGIALFAALHLRLLAWNIREYRRYRNTEAFAELRQRNGEASLMVIPLTLAMSINVGFVLGAVFVPGLWSVVEYLFPFAIAGFVAVGIHALQIYTRFITRVLSSGFDFDSNNDLSQLFSIFAFAMISVGLAAPGAMSHQQEINALGIFLSIFFGSIAVALGLLKLVLGFKSMLRMGISPVASPSLWTMIPILTLLGIATIRMNFGLHHGFNHPVSAPGLFVFTSVILSLQLLFGLVGYRVMKHMGYFRDYLHGENRHPGSYSLICPGVALFVFGMFFLAFGLQRNGLVERFSLTYFLLLAPLVYLQLKTVLTMFRLNRRLLRAMPA